MFDRIREWLGRAAESASRRVARVDNVRDVTAEVHGEDGGSEEGPWLFTDALNRQWVLSTAPLAHDPTLSADAQLKALVCNCEDGWIFALPVGADFHADQLSTDEICRLLLVAEGNARQVSDWEPSRSEARVIHDPQTALEYKVQIVSRRDALPAVEVGTAAQALVFRERGGDWVSSTPLPLGIAMESLSPADLMRYLQHALDVRPRLALGAFRPQRPGQRSTSNLILLVEDEDELRRIYRIALERAGFQVIGAREGEQALALVEQHGAELRAVISDVVMPRIGGRELLWRLSEKHAGLPVILISGLLDRTQVAESLKAEPAWFLPKPFSPRELVEVVEKVIGGASGTLLPE